MSGRLMPIAVSPAAVPEPAGKLGPSSLLADSAPVGNGSTTGVSHRAPARRDLAPAESRLAPMSSDPDTGGWYPTGMGQSRLFGGCQRAVGLGHLLG